MAEERYSVCHFFEDGSHDVYPTVCGLNDAVDNFADSVVSGTTTAVFMLESDCLALEWTVENGVRRVGLLATK